MGATHWSGTTQRASPWRRAGLAELKRVQFFHPRRPPPDRGMVAQKGSRRSSGARPVLQDTIIAALIFKDEGHQALGHIAGYEDGTCPGPLQGDAEEIGDVKSWRSVGPFLTIDSSAYLP